MESTIHLFDLPYQIYYLSDVTTLSKAGYTDNTSYVKWRET